ncbi:UNKNOWN [Stylonychia lemnae]|uniref:Uncharacterized protein n=1 Tax=Stylonychia lemnae TaxID=5949 RepID=A0A077ZZA6_STYLE|nr:UNKNOWN [Stylonychia lemnae]|eukprot:CDW75281.1 UNKNOWN [Stylonychia lemnae]
MAIDSVKKQKLCHNNHNRFIDFKMCKNMNMIIEQICFSLRNIGLLVLQEYSKDLASIGIVQDSGNLCDPYILSEGEQKTFIENFKCYKRILLQFTKVAVEYYCQLNNFFERKPIADSQMQLILLHLMVARFRTIELLGLLQTDIILKVKSETTNDIEDEKMQKKKIIETEQNYFKKREEIAKLNALEQQVQNINPLDKQSRLGPQDDNSNDQQSSLPKISEYKNQVNIKDRFSNCIFTTKHFAKRNIDIQRCSQKQYDTKLLQN